ncbi:Methyltransferase [Mesorhizobium sp. ORS 3359]|nr:Methyltransferase [Mesorhizobium sp. ORS 3359]
MLRTLPDEPDPTKVNRYEIVGADVSEATMFRGDVLVSSLSETPRFISSMYYYDDIGFALYDRLCREDSYYLSRDERSILHTHARTIADITGHVALVELGSGNAEKTTLLMDAYAEAFGPISYAAIDINRSMLERAFENILSATTDVHFTGILGTYKTGLEQAAALTGPKLLISLGASIGNLYDDELHDLLGSVQACLQDGDYFLFGIDLEKESGTLEAAYNNQSAVLANLCVLRHLNWRFGGDFDLLKFRHIAFHNKRLHRMEGHLEAMQDQFINLEKLKFSFHLKEGELIRTEIMRKVRLPHFHGMFAKYGLAPVQHWTGENQRYAVSLLQRFDKVATSDSQAPDTISHGGS